MVNSIIRWATDNVWAGYNRYLIGVCSYQSTRKHFSDRQSCRRYATHLLTTLSENYKVAYFRFFFSRESTLSLTVNDRYIGH